MGFAHVDGRPVYYERHGDPTPGRTPLVLLAGLGGSCQGWKALQVPELSGALPLILIDHRGAGESADPGGSFSTADLADDLAAVLDAIDVPRAHVLGTFLGGMVAQEFALRHPERLDHLILVGTWARADAKRRLLLEKWQAMAHEGTSAEVFIRERLLWTLHEATLEKADLIEAMSRSYPGAEAPPSAELIARQCGACLGHDTFDRLSRIEAPTLVVCGREDQLTPAKFHRELADEMPNARLVTLPWGAHLVMAESAQDFHKTILGFLGRAPAGSPD